MLTGISPEKHPSSLPFRPPAVYAEKAGPLEGMFKYGKQGGIEYKPNWGQPISETGKWLSQQEAQPASFDAGQLLQQNLETLKADFRNKAKRLRDAGLDPEAHNRILADMQAEYDQGKAKFAGVQSQMDFIKKAVASGTVDPTAANEAMARLVLPAGVADAMFPTPKAGPMPSVAGTTPPTYESLTKRFSGAGKATLVNPSGRSWLARNVVDPGKLKKLYENERRIANLNDPRNIGKVAGFNQAFVDAISGLRGGEEALNKLMEDNPNWFATPSKLGQVFNQKVSGKSVSPLAKSVAPKPKLQPIDVSQMSDEELRRIAGGE